MEEEKKPVEEDKKIQKADSSEPNTDDPTVIPPEILESIPEGERARFTSIFRQVMVSGGRNNLLLDKLTPEHISKVLDYSDVQDKRDRDERTGERGHNFKVLIISLLFILILCGLFIFANQVEFLKYIIGGLLGFMGGFGVGKYYRKEDK